jgi:hypothetical protein
MTMRGGSLSLKLWVGVGLVFCVGTAVAQAGNGGGDAKKTAPTVDATTDTILTPAQEKDLLASEDEILHFVSKDTGLPIKEPVKCRFVSREALQKMLIKNLNDDKGAKRMERSELVLKKFGLLDEDFHLKPFMLSLLTEQIAGFYDNKTKMMTLLDWVPIEQQKPVMAHELTHALQDQKLGLAKWGSQEIEGMARNVAEDNRHIATDETDTAREAVLEGQAMVSFADHMLAENGQAGKTLKDFPQMSQMIEQNAADTSDEPEMARAPLVIQQALLFPYTAGLAFEQAVLTKEGTHAAFDGVLDAPPSSSFEIMTPDAYMAHATVPLMRLPDIHPLLKAAGYEPYDVGVMGELDVRMTAELFGGRPLAEALAPNWEGGIYYAAQRKSASEAEKQTTASLALLYSSQWKNEDSARNFFSVFEQQMPRQYDGLVRRKADEVDENERVFTTKEGDVLLTVSGKTVWVSEGFDLALARKLRDQIAAVNVPPGNGPVLSTGLRSGELLGGVMSEFGMLRAELR